MLTRNPIRNLQRWREVQAIFFHYGFDILIDQREIKEVRRFLQDKLHLSAGKFDDRPLPEKIRLMLEELGPTYIKLGQMLSSRSDLLPVDWITELTRLQDDVPPFPLDQVLEIITQEFDAPLESYFAHIDPQSIAAASIGQVHRATLLDGQAVVIKVQRPGIGPRVLADIEIMRELARILESRASWARRYGVAGVLDEFSRSLIDELDYRNEARNADRLRRNMAVTPEVHTPLIYWHLVTARVLTMGEVNGVKITDLAALAQAKIDLEALAERFIRCVIQQILLDGFFHADPHPGNVFVDLETGGLIFLDLGMMGQLVEEQRVELGNLMQALQQPDTREVVRVVLTVGTTESPVRELVLRRDLDRLLGNYLTQPLAKMSFAGLLNEMLTLLFKHDIRLPHELTLAIKALMQAEAIARTLNPKIQIIDVAHTVAKQLALQRLDPRTITTQLVRDAREMVRLAHTLPIVIEQLLKQVQSGKLTVGLEAPELLEQGRHLNIIGNRLTAGLVIVGMIIGSAIAMGVSPQQSWAFIPLLGVFGFVLSLGVGLLLIWRVLLDLWRGD